MDKQFLEQLLYEDESETLDFKRDQYAFTGANDDAKSELLKDIVAFANAWRRTEAHILIGVQEVKGGRSKPVGVSQDIDDASLQQFVNSKLNKRLDFAYETLECDGKSVALIRIPVQERPFYLTRDFGKLKKDEVPIRRGSSTGQAGPGEVARMVKSDMQTLAARDVKVEFYDPREEKSSGKRVLVKTLNIGLTDGVDKIPDYRPGYPAGNFVIPDVSANADFYREAYEYVWFYNAFAPLCFQVTNDNQIPLNDVDLIIDGLPPDMHLLRDADVPDEPDSEWGIAAAMSQKVQPCFEIGPEITRNKEGFWRLEAGLDKIKAGMVDTTSRFWVGASDKVEVDIQITVAADESSAPIIEDCFVRVEPTAEAMSAQEFIKRLSEWDLDNPFYRAGAVSVGPLGE